MFGCIEEQERKNGGFRSKITKLEKGRDVSNTEKTLARSQIQRVLDCFARNDAEKRKVIYKKSGGVHGLCCKPLMNLD